MDVGIIIIITSGFLYFYSVDFVGFSFDIAQEIIRILEVFECVFLPLKQEFGVTYSKILFKNR